MKEYICPISFINEKQERSTDLNELFIAGYRDKVCSDYTTSLMVDFEKKSYDFDNLTSEQIGWLNDVASIEHKAFVDSIISYLICNITDLTINTLILALQILKMPNDLIDNNVDYLINKLEVRDIVMSAVSGNFQHGYYREDSIEQTYILLNMKMNTVYSVLTTRVFDNFVEKFMGLAAANGGIQVIFETLYMYTYNSKDWNPDTSYSNMYAFSSAIMREAIDRYTMDFRKGLMDIALTAASMIHNNPKYGLNTNNPNYITTTEEYENTGLFGNCLEAAVETIGIEGQNNDN